MKVRKIHSILVADNNTKTNYLQALKEENINLINDKLKTESDNKTIDVLNTFKSKLLSLNDVKQDKLDESIMSCLELIEKLK